MLKCAIEKLMNNTNLTEEEMQQSMIVIMDGEANPTQMAAFLTALRMKKETAEEITGGAKVMRAKAAMVELKDMYAIDTCGTGGDGTHTFNISTTVAFIAAAAGVKVAKHGNRSASSKCGSADVLEKLGVKLTLSPEKVAECVEKVGLGFMFAPSYHTAMKHVAGTRKELGIRTIFNILGPLANPAAVRGQVLGVYDESLTEIMANALNNLGVERALVVHGQDGMDEITLTNKTKYCLVLDGKVISGVIDPRDYGFSFCSKEDLQGGTAEENAAIILAILNGEIGFKRDIAVLNAAAAIYIGKKANSIEDGIKIAQQVVDNKSALNKLQQLIRVSQED